MTLRQRVGLPLLTALFLVLAAPADSPQTAPNAASAPGGAAAEAAGATPKRAVLRLRETRFGEVIHEKSSGLVAYLFTKDGKNKSRCNGACAKAWPPIKTKRAPQAGSGLDQSDLGTIKRRGGSKMVTYRGRPLYFYVHDSPGEILCNDVVEFGGTWFVVDKTGKPV